MKGQSWLQDHLNNFVGPYLGFIPKYAGVPYFTAQEKTIIKNVWRSVKSQLRGRQLVLAGRDVFVWEILARRENFPTLFLPECSREAVDYVKLPTKEMFLFDTGFVGSIPRTLNLWQSCNLLSYDNNRSDISKQTFPRLSGARGLALRIESTPKYWQTGRVTDGKVIQHLASREVFAQAVQITYEIYRDSSPKFQDVIERRRRYTWKSNFSLW